jgi:hypothetical protein
MLVDLGRLEREYFERWPDLDDPKQRPALVPAGIAAHRCTARSPKPIFWPSPKPSATSGACRASMARCLWRGIRTRFPGPPSTRRWKFSPAITCTPSSSRSGWFAARPSGTEAVYKIYGESFKDEAPERNRPRRSQAGTCRGLGLGRTSQRKGGMMGRWPSVGAVST